MRLYKTKQQLEHFGMQLKISRMKKDFNQEYCADKVGCTTRAWYRWEKGHTYPLAVYRPLIMSLLPDLNKI